MSTMTRTAWGIDTPRDQTPRPHCTPHTATMWELDPPRGRTSVIFLRPDNLTAIHLCHTCPAQTLCRTETATMHPRDRALHILHAIIYNTQGHPADPRRVTRTQGAP